MVERAAFSFQPVAVQDENVLTAQELLNVPLDQWDSILEKGGTPNDMATFEQKLNNAVENAHWLAADPSVSATATGVEWIAKGWSDDTLQYYDNDIDAYMKDDSGSYNQAITLPAYVDTIADAYRNALQIRQDYPPGADGSENPNIQAGIDAVMGHYNSSVQDVTDAYREKIQQVMEKLNNPEPAPPAGPEQDVHTSGPGIAEPGVTQFSV